ncbi:hypothetical protein COCNU_16G004740 [Cocos nucifera]|uniref:Small ribosomal subunit protein mS41 SAM domain-containing protein n=1 Tax=Cocos nucifera TaxID=13894 RepID=A0A8K0IY95_COCNU|nr:hypothetical protein COCNU_16G004740 [Cocos nucifera]
MALVAQCWKRLLAGGGGAAAPPPLLHRFYAVRSCSWAQYEVKMGIPEFLKGVGNGVEAHAAKLEAEIGDFQKLLVTRTLRLKKLGIPCKHVPLLILFDSWFPLLL